MPVENTMVVVQLGLELIGLIYDKEYYIKDDYMWLSLVIF